MRHGVGYKKLGRTTAHRRAMFRNQLASLVEHGRIQTTLAKAKALRPVAEKMITRGREDTVHARRLVRRWLPNRDHVKKLFDEIAPRYADRPGGYLRITKLGPRRGDAAERAVIEFVDTDE
ncbi:MAG: 50S ribosomal protein L17 [Acidobacteria bacterium]|nr:50S ribosomal protein L17 [Acidobacteriota bacterium]MCY3929710.1 50S ribosomal protein L17 [Acidobacteriota bacterium]MXZ38926.1 50S ribosomal protein L17 [Holophagales bacterium]